MIRRSKTFGGSSRLLPLRTRPLREELDELRVRLGARRKPPPRPHKIKVDVRAARVGVQFIEAFNVRLIEQTTAAWEFYFGLLQRFIEREGDSRVPQRHHEDGGYWLGAWVSNQRAARPGLRQFMGT